MNIRKRVNTPGSDGPTYCSRNCSWTRHQVVIEAFEATVQGVGDSALVVIQGGVHGLLGSQWAPWRLLCEERTLNSLK